MDYVEIIGLLAGTCTSLSLLPQVIRTIQIRETKDISLSMYIVLSTGLFLWIIYGVQIESLPVALANVISLVFAVIILTLKVKYG